MKVGIMGFGKTGKAVAAVMLESNKVSLEWVIRRSHKMEHRSVPEFLGVESENPGLIYSKDEFTAFELLDKFPVDVIVDFSSVDGIHYYSEEAARRGVIIVSAVSQYPDEELKLIRELANRTIVMHSPNITLGINFIIIAGKILKKIAPFTDIEVIEEHFKAKTEISGTAKIIARELDVAPDNIKSIRAGGIIGVHEILFGFPYQVVRLRHESITREAFGNGILFAIENLIGKAKGFYTMEDIMLPYFKLQEEESEIIKSGKKPWWKFWLKDSV